MKHTLTWCICKNLSFLSPISDGLPLVEEAGQGRCHVLKQGMATAIDRQSQLKAQYQWDTADRCRR